MSESKTPIEFPMAMDHLVILASDLTQSLAFYSALLPMIGFKKNNEHVFSNAQGIYLDFRAATEPQHGYHRYGPGLNHLGFTAHTRQEIEQIRQEMERQGFAMPEIQDFDEDCALFIKDPDGLRFELTHYANAG